MCRPIEDSDRSTTRRIWASPSPTRSARYCAEPHQPAPSLPKLRPRFREADFLRNRGKKQRTISRNTRASSGRRPTATGARSARGRVCATELSRIVEPQLSAYTIGAGGVIVPRFSRDQPEWLAAPSGALAPQFRPSLPAAQAHNDHAPASNTSAAIKALVVACARTASESSRLRYNASA
jgi:hypothetical protein